MELFKILGTIAIKNDEANKAIKDTAQNAKGASKDVDDLGNSGEKSGGKLSAAFSKVGSLFAKMFENSNAKNVEKSFDSLTATTEKQKERLEELKNEYKNMYIQHGKNSSEAKKVAAEIKQLSGEINKNEKQMDKASGAADKFDKSLDDVGKAADKADSKLSKFFSGVGKGSLKLAKWTAVGIGAAATAIGGLTVKALSAAGDLEQNIGGAEAVFGELGKTIGDMSTPMQQYNAATGKVETVTKSLEQVSKQAFQNMGLSQTEYLATANKMGALFKGAGFETQEALDLSSSAMQRAADVASIMGIDTASAMDAVANAAKGNFTMMDNLGVAMNDTAIAAYAASKGINKTTAEMTQQEKIGLAMEMFMDKTAYAAGNYAKENETLAGSLGTAKAALTNFLAGSGSVEDIVSSFSNFANVVVNMLDEMFPQLMTGLTQIVDQIVPLIPPLLQKILPPLIEGATSLINGLVAALPAVMQALMGALPALIEGVMSIVDALIGALPGILEAIVSALPTLIPMLIDAVVGLIMMLVEMLPQIIQPIIDYLPEIIVSIVEALLGNLPVLIQGCVQLIGALIAALPQILSALWETIKGLFGSLGSMIGGFFEPVKNIVSEKCENIKAAASEKFSAMVEAVKGFFVQLGKNLVSFFTSTVPNLIAQIGKWFNELPGKIGYALGFVIGKLVAFGVESFNWVKTNVPKIINNIITFFKTLPEKVWTWLKNTISKITTWGSEMASKAKTAASTFVNNAINTIKNLPGNIQTWLTNVINKVVSFGKDMASKGKNAALNLFNAIVNKVKEMPGKMLSMGKDIVTGLWNGIKNAKDWIVGKVKDFASGILKGMKDALGIKSPSRRFRDEVGKMIAEGVAVGIDENTDKVKEKAEDMAKKVLDAAQKRLEKYQLYNDLTLADEVAFWDGVRQQCAEGTDARLEADKKYVAAKKSLNSQLLTAEQTLQNEIADIQKSVADRTKELLNMTGSGFGEALSGDELLGNLKHEVFGLEEYEKTIAALEARIGGTKAFDDVKAGGIGSLNKAYEMAYFMTDDQIQQYVDLYERKYSAATKMAQEEMADDVVTRTAKAYQAYADTCGSLGVEIVGSTESMQQDVSNSFGLIENSINNVSDAFAKLKQLFESFDMTTALPTIASWFASGTAPVTSSPSAYSFGAGGTASGEQSNWFTAFLQKFLESIQGMKVVMDSGALVGEIAIPMDEALGMITTRKDRGR